MQAGSVEGHCTYSVVESSTSLKKAFLAYKLPTSTETYKG